MQLDTPQGREREGEGGVGDSGMGQVHQGQCQACNTALCSHQTRAYLSVFIACVSECISHNCKFDFGGRHPMQHLPTAHNRYVHYFNGQITCQRTSFQLLCCSCSLPNACNAVLISLVFQLLSHYFGLILLSYSFLQVLWVCNEP